MIAAGSKGQRIPSEIAHGILVTFGITRSSPAYERRVKEDGFDSNDFRDVLRESPAIVGVDWRSPLGHALEDFAAALKRLGVQIAFEDVDDTGSGYVACEARRVDVSYMRAGDDFDEVVRRLQSILPPEIEIRASPFNVGSDGWYYAVIPREEWAKLIAHDPVTMSGFFGPLPPPRPSPSPLARLRRLLGWCLP